jgi:hypothetical protein
VRHTAFIYDRGASGAPMGQVDGVVRVKWNRQRDAISEAEIVGRATAPGCCELLSRTRSMRHELVIMRDGERVWEGPITRRNLSRGGGFRLAARDVMFYSNRTTIKVTYSSAYPNIEKVTDRAARVMRGELAFRELKSPPFNIVPGIEVYTNAQTTKTSKVTKPGPYVWSDIDSMAQRNSLDYVVVNRRTLLFDTHQYIGQGRRLVDADFLDGLEVVEYGVELATRTFTQGADDKIGDAVIDDPTDYYGGIELLAGAYDSGDTSATAPTQEELDEQAERNLRSRFPAPIVLRVPENSQLAPNVVDELMPYLIPGVAFPVFSDQTCQTVEQMQKLDRVAFEESASGEKVSVTLSSAPVGAEGFAAEET